MKLNSEQQEVFYKILEDIELNEQEGNFDFVPYLITGKAGSGKSFLSAVIIKHLTQKYKVQCTALTHKALNEIKKKIKDIVSLEELNGISTVHSYFKIKPQINYKTGVEEFKLDNNSRNKPRKCDVLFIDEVSMLCPELWKIIKNQRHLYKHIILIGDEFQIPPVNESTGFNIFQDPNIKTFKLKNIVRQAKDNPIINFASEIVEKIENKDFKDKAFCIKKAIEYNKYDEINFVEGSDKFIQEYYNYVKDSSTSGTSNFYESTFSKAIITAFTNDAVNNFNVIAKCMYKKVNPKNLNYIDTGDVLVLQEPAFDPYLPDDIIFQNNSDFLVEDLEKDTYEGIPIFKVYTNGTFIRVVQPHGLSIYNNKLQNFANKAKLDGRLWKQFYDFKKRFCTVKQAFAVTCHKAQGSTYPVAFVDATNLPWSTDTDLAFRLFYVAITRASEKVIIRG